MFDLHLEVWKRGRVQTTTGLLFFTNEDHADAVVTAADYYLAYDKTD